jgi:eukaryotic-like serine/threonine-protein kinase
MPADAASTPVVVPGSFGFAGESDDWLDIARRASARPEPGYLGGYRIVERIGAGGQGVVYRAVQPGTGRTVALKRLAAGRFADAGSLSRVQREVEAIAALSHPGIVTLHGVEVIDRVPVLVMEHVDGMPIHRWAHSPDGPRPLQERLATFLQCCDAISFAHSRGVIHCDLKPGNILVDSSGRARIVDFGLARLQDQAVTTSGFRGTPAYAPPEQLVRRGHVPDSRSDIYALGAVLYVLVTGRAPFDPGASVAELIDAVRTAAPAPFPCPDLRHRELKAIIHKAMAKSPEDRYQSVFGLASDIRRLLDGRPVLAHPPSATYQVRAFVRRRPITCAAGGTALLAIVGLAVTSTALAFTLEQRQEQLYVAIETAGDAAAEAQARAEDARLARAHAEAEARRAQANAEFMLRFLEDIAGAVQRGDARPDPLLIQQARERLESEQLGDQPEVRAVLWRTLGLLYVRVGRPAVAAEVVQTALDMHLQTFGPDHAETGRCYYLAGLVAEQRWDLIQAEAFDREAVRVLTGALGEVHTETALAVNNLGCVLKNLMLLDEAERCHQQALATWKIVHGEHHRYVAMSLRNLGTLERTRNRYDLAESYYEQAMQVALVACTPRDPLNDSIRHNIARLRSRQGDPHAAELICRSIVERHIALHGPVPSLQIGNIYFDMSRYIAVQGKHDQAMIALEAARPHFVWAFGETSPNTLLLELRIGDSAAAAGRHTEARESYERALRLAAAMERTDLVAKASGRIDRLAALPAPAKEADEQP